MKRTLRRDGGIPDRWRDVAEQERTNQGCAASARKAYFLELARKSAQARARRKAGAA